MSQLVIYRYDLRVLACESPDQMQRFHAAVIFIDTGRLVIFGLRRIFRDELFMEFCLPIQKTAGFDVIGDIVYLVNSDSGGLQAVSNGFVWQPATLADSDALDANQFFFLDGGDNPSILEQRRGRITSMSGNTKNIHLIRPLQYKE
jgi:hypothetical protein